jgi:formate dehydrogenase subunit beta
MNPEEKELKTIVRKLLFKGTVDVVIGFEKGTIPARMRPAFFRDANAVDRLVWNSHCSNNLAVYLPAMFRKPMHAKDWKPPKVAIVAKGCDGRSVVGLLKEKQVPRDNIVIIGMPCPGMMDGDELQQACLECTHPFPEVTDIAVGGSSREKAEKRHEQIIAFEAKSPDQRWQYFTEEISKCIRCYSCRQACPNCYCETCFADQTKPRWLGVGDDISDVMSYHIGRIFHQAGRCVECDACVRACPMGINLRLFTQKLPASVEKLFGYIPGLSEEEPPLLCTFSENDNQDFITEPDK